MIDIALKADSADDIIKEAIRLGTESAIFLIQKNQNTNKSRKTAYRNTKLLLKNYRNFISVSNELKNDIALSKDKIQYYSMLCDFFENSEYKLRENIRTKERTGIFISHINAMLKTYKLICMASKEKAYVTKYNILYDMYLSPQKISAKQLIKKYEISERSFYYFIESAIKELTPLIFGI